MLELQKEQPELFTKEKVEVYRKMLRRGVEEEIEWARYVLDDRIEGLNMQMIEDYIRYLGNLRAAGLHFEPLYEGYQEVPASMKWVNDYSNANNIKTDFFEAKSTAYAKSSAIEDDL